MLANRTLEKIRKALEAFGSARKVQNISVVHDQSPIYQNCKEPTETYSTVQYRDILSCLIGFVGKSFNFEARK